MAATKKTKRKKKISFDPKDYNDSFFGSMIKMEDGGTPQPNIDTKKARKYQEEKLTEFLLGKLGNAKTAYPDRFEKGRSRKVKMSRGGNVASALDTASAASSLAPGIAAGIGSGGTSFLLDNVALPIVESLATELINDFHKPTGQERAQYSLDHPIQNPTSNLNPYGMKKGGEILDTSPRLKLGKRIKNQLINTIDSILHPETFIKGPSNGIDRNFTGLLGARWAAQKIHLKTGGEVTPETAMLLKNGGTITDPMGNVLEPGSTIQFKGGGFHLNPAHKGWCTPMTKSTCTGKRRQFAINAKNHFQKQEDGGLTYAADQFCMGGKMEDGGQPNVSTIDIEKGEARVGQDQYGRSVIKERYNNPNKFSKHAKNPNHEPVGNFVKATEGEIIISAPQFNTYSQGDDITRKSIERKLVKRQEIEHPEQLGIQRSKKGGMVIRKYQHGGVNPLFPELNSGLDYLNDPNNIGNTDAIINGFPSDYTYNQPSNIPTNFQAPNVDPFTNYDLPGGNEPNPISPYNDPSKFGIETQPQRQFPTDTSGGVPNTAFDKIYANVGRIAPVAANAYQFFGALSPDKVARVRNAGYPQALNTLRGLKDTINVQPQLNAIGRNTKAQIDTVNNGMNPAVNNARLNQVSANAIGATNDVLGAKINTDTQLGNAKKSAIAGLQYQGGAEDAQHQAAQNLAQEQNLAAARQIRNSAVANTGTELSQFSSEDKMRKIIGEAMGQYFNFDPKKPWSGDHLFTVNEDEANSAIKLILSENPTADLTKVFSDEVLKAHKYEYDPITKQWSKK